MYVQYPVLDPICIRLRFCVWVCVHELMLLMESFNSARTTPIYFVIRYTMRGNNRLLHADFPFFNPSQYSCVLEAAAKAAAATAPANRAYDRTRKTIDTVECMIQKAFYKSCLLLLLLLV